VSSKCTLFVLEAARRGDVALAGLIGAGWVGSQKRIHLMVDIYM